MVIRNNKDIETLDLQNCLALGCYEPSSEVLFVLNGISCLEESLVVSQFCSDPIPTKNKLYIILGLQKNKNRIQETTYPIFQVQYHPFFQIKFLPILQVQF